MRLFELPIRLALGKCKSLEHNVPMLKLSIKESSENSRSNDNRTQTAHLLL
jgi:hypothetical protein